MADASDVHAMCTQMKHRGPDDEGIHTDRGCGIGMRRLSIIDLSTGHQPIANEDGSVWVVFNGEIYDYANLRAGLMAQGHQFKTNSDTETLIHLYEQEGVEGIRKLRGMFAYAIWDGRKQELMLARDRYGKKPLYYAITPEGFYFASELSCLRVAGIPLEVDEEAIRLYFLLGYVPDPWSIYKNVRKLPAASWMIVRPDGSTRQGKYWDMPVPQEHAPPGLTPEIARQKIRDVFDESVRLRMIADVPLGAFLSGGIDSSSVVASMALQSKDPVKTFSIGFREADFNELDWARMVAKKYNTEHHEILVEPDSVSLVNRLVRHFGEPFADSSAIPTFIVSEFAARHVKVTLTGDGGDELFAGYESFFLIQKLRKADAIPGFAKSILNAVAEALPYSAYGKNYLRMLGRANAFERYFENNHSPYFLRKELLEDRWMLPADGAYLTKALGHFLLPGNVDVLTQALYFEATAKLQGDMLVKVDRMSMANSLEVRCPMLDHHLGELAAQIPHDWKIKNGRGKQIFIEALGDRLPPELLNRPKMGFGVPLPKWFRGSLREFLWDHLTSKQLFNRNIVSPDFVRNLLTEHDTGRRNNTHWLWTILMLELWFRDFESEPESAVVTTSGRVESR